MRKEDLLPYSHGPRPHLITDRHLRRQAVVYVRQSSPGQVRDHEGSTGAQRDLVELPRRWGWPEHNISIIESDLGVSATNPTVRRDGFQELLTLVSEGKVGLVVIRDVSRLARRMIDAVRFLESASRTGTLIEANGKLYDPSREDDQDLFILMLEGLLAWRDASQRSRTMMSARVAKARRGAAVSPPPIGYVAATDGKWIKDPDERVREAVGRLFDLYPKLGSLGKVVKHLRNEGLPFPRRRGATVTWGPIDLARLHSILKNPGYTGDYVFRRYNSRPTSDENARIRPRSEWIVVEDHHEPYVAAETWQRIQQLLASRDPAMGTISGKGGALLQGLLRCASCNRPFHTKYWGRSGVARAASYRCVRKDGWGEVTHKIVIPARLVDQAVVRRVLAAIQPLDIETATATVRHALADEVGLQRTRRQQLQEAEDAVDRLRQAYYQADPTNRRVKLDFEEQLGRALVLKDDLEARFAAPTTTPPVLSASDAVELVELTSEVEALWAAETTTVEDRKAILRAVLEHIVIRAVSTEHVELEIVWATGEREGLTILKAKGVQIAAKERHAAGHSIDAIAEEFRATGVKTALGAPISRTLLAAKLRYAGTPITAARLEALKLIRDAVLDNVRRRDLRARLEARFPNLGPWTAQRLADAICELRDGVRGIEPLPMILPAEAEKQQVLAAIDADVQAGHGWRAIAKRLNASGLKPPRGEKFTGTQVRLLHLRNRSGDIAV